jgi:hypothetical protein
MIFELISIQLATFLVILSWIHWIHIDGASIKTNFWFINAIFVILDFGSIPLVFGHLPWIQ